MFAKKVEEKAAAVSFTALAAIMYYSLDGYFDFGVYVTYRHVLAVLLIVSAFVCFLVRPNVARMATVWKDCLAFSAPTFVFLFVSLFLWCYNKENPSVIARGLSSNFFFINHFSSVFAAGAFLYMFGEKGIWYNLAAILAANLLMLAGIMAEYGVGVFFGQLVTLVLTFAGETGKVIVLAEIHELAFCLGLYLIFMMLHYRRRLFFHVLFFLALFCFTAAFKRIAVLGLMVIVPLGQILTFWAHHGQKKTVSKILMILMAAACIIPLAYIGLVHAGLFSWMEKAGINTMTRSGAYEWAAQYYTFSPSFMGRGIGFLTYQLQNDGNSIGLNTIHNDFLQYFVDLGFWGFLLWIFSMTVFRVWYFGRGGKINTAVSAAAIVLWTFVVSSTDNTPRYPLFITVMALLTIGDGFDERTKEMEKKIFRDRIQEEESFWR